MKQLLLILFFFSVISSFTQKVNKDSVFVFYFKPAKAKISGDSLLRFKQFYKKFEGCQSCIFELKGFTDSVGDLASNLQLSKQRIDYVRSLLVKHSKTQFREFPIGEKMAQKTKNNQEFRKVILRVFIPKKENVKSKTLDLSDSLSPHFKRYVEFKQLNTTIRLQILFELNEVEMLKESETEVEVLTLYLLQNPHLKAKLLGHVCCLNNSELSYRRALKIKETLIKRGVSENRLKAEGFGNRRPIVNEYNAKDEQINRRVEVVFYE